MLLVIEVGNVNKPDTKIRRLDKIVSLQVKTVVIQCPVS